MGDAGEPPKITTHHEWADKTTATDVAKAFSSEIKGKTVLIAGVSPNSLGETMALGIASQHPSTLLLASRTAGKLAIVSAQIESLYPSVDVKTFVIDLSSLASVRSTADEINGAIPKIDVLILNAATVHSSRAVTADGLEMQFGTNHVGPFLFTNLILPKLVAAARAPGAVPGATRIVTLTSAGHRLSPIRFGDYNFEGKPLGEGESPPPGLPEHFFEKDANGNPSVYSGFVAYGQSKTANILFVLELKRKLLAKSGIQGFSTHPGSIWTDLSRNLDESAYEVVKTTGTFWKNQDQGSATTLVAAFDPALNETNKVYLGDCQILDPAPHAEDPATAERLWKLSEEIVGQKFDLEAL